MHPNIRTYLDRLTPSQRKWALKLLRAPRNYQISHRGGTFYFEEKDALRGLLPTLKDALWPLAKFSDQRATATCRTSTSDRGIAAQRKRAVARAKAIPSSSKGKGWQHGRYRGSTVHQQLEDYVNHSRTYYNEVHGKSIHPFTVRVLKHFARQQWAPLVAEFQVFDRELGTATAMDFIAVNMRNGKLVCIELKTGYTDSFTASLRTMTGPLRNILPDSPLNQAVLQVIMPMLFIHKHHGIPLSAMEGYVVRVDDQQVQHYPVQPKFIRAHARSVYQHVWHSQKARKKRPRAKSTKIPGRPHKRRRSERGN